MFSVMNIISCVCLYFLISLTNTRAEVLQCYVCVDCDKVNETHIATCLKPDESTTEPSITEETSTIALSDTPSSDRPETSTLLTNSPETGASGTDGIVTSSGSDSDGSTSVSETSVTEGYTIVDSTKASTTEESTIITSTTEPPLTTTSNYASISETTVIVVYTPAAQTSTVARINEIAEEITKTSDTDNLLAEVPLIKYVANIETPTEHGLDTSTDSRGTDEYNTNVIYGPDFLRVLQELRIDTEPSKSGPFSESSEEKVEIVQTTHANAKRSSRLRREILGTLREDEGGESVTRCVVTSFIENNKTKIVRGCSFLPGNPEDSCRELIAGVFTGNLTQCMVCEKNLCNAAYKSGITLVVFLLALFVKI